jgi:hypothetical protein
MGLLRGLARATARRPSPAAAIAQHVARRQVLLWLDRVPPSARPDLGLAQLTELHRLGLLRDEEFLAQVQRATR